MYTKLRELFSLYEETNGFCVVPEGAAEEEPHDFISRKIEEIRSIEQNFSLYMDEQEIAELKKLKPKLMTLDLGLAVTGIAPEAGEVFDKLHQILNDLESVKASKDKLILLGDYIDRGPESYKVLKKVYDMQQECSIEKLLW